MDPGEGRGLISDELAATAYQKIMKLFQNLWSREAPANAVRRPVCDCLAPQYGREELDDVEEEETEDELEGEEEAIAWTELQLHTEEQDTECHAWQRLNELIEQAAADGRARFSPGPEMTPAEWAQITELPRSIAKLKSVKSFTLYGSSLVRIPPEVGEMTALEEFVPYTSYRLHWFPYEITRCKNLRKSTVSTRALYGNYKYRPPFPKLPQIQPGIVPACCSVCRTPFGDAGPLQYWISLGVARDVLPLLVHACSERCVEALPRPTEGYVGFPHQGGLGLEQPGAED